MSLTFPNRSRSYDGEAQLVRFIGYDGMFEIRIGVPGNALPAGPVAGLAAEADYLAAFDANRGLIEEAARKVYSKHRANLFFLTRADLRG